MRLEALAGRKNTIFFAVVIEMNQQLAGRSEDLRKRRCAAVTADTPSIRPILSPFLGSREEVTLQHNFVNKFESEGLGVRIGGEI